MTPYRRHHAAGRTLAVVLAGLIASLAAGCGSTTDAQRTTDTRCRESSGGSATLDLDRDGSNAVTELTVTLLDHRRPTPAIPGRAALPCRVLRTEVRYPTRVIRPVPLVVVAHGLDGSPRSIGPLLNAWAAAGYVVAAPTFPTTRKDSHGTSLPAESVDQAADMSFVIDQLLQRSHSNAPGPLSGLIDPRHIGAAGMSLGGLSVYGLVSNTCCRDARVRAAILMAAVRRQFPDERYEDNQAPVLLVQGDADTGYHNSRDAYPELVPPKWFITLHGSAHSPPFEVPPGPEAPLVYSTTAWFWDRYLKNDSIATRRIDDAVSASHGQATLRRDLGH
jgi:dienelactone hydrolase